MSIGWPIDGSSPPNGPAGGDLGSSYPAPTVVGLRNQPILAGAPTLNQVLAYNGTAWQNVPRTPLEYSPTFSLATVTTANPPGSPISYMSLGTAMAPIVLNPAGTYEISGGFTLQVSANNTQVWITLLFNGLPPPAGPFVEELGAAGAQVPRAFNSSLPAALLGPTLYLDFLFAKNAGTGVVTIKQGYIWIRRVL